MEANNNSMYMVLRYIIDNRSFLDFCHNNLSSKTWKDWDKVYYFLRDIIDMAMEAVEVKPPRNCDVGTAEEQLDRYGLFCQNKCPICDNRHSCHICGERYRMKCMMKWTQMPYNESEMEK